MINIDAPDQKWKKKTNINTGTIILSYKYVNGMMSLNHLMNATNIISIDLNKTNKNKFIGSESGWPKCTDLLNGVVGFLWWHI